MQWADIPVYQNPYSFLIYMYDIVIYPGGIHKLHEITTPFLNSKYKAVKKDHNFCIKKGKMTII